MTEPQQIEQTIAIEPPKHRGRKLGGKNKPGHHVSLRCQRGLAPTSALEAELGRAASTQSASMCHVDS
jgi:hypothetical protein